MSDLQSAYDSVESRVEDDEDVEVKMLSGSKFDVVFWRGHRRVAGEEVGYDFMLEDLKEIVEENGLDFELTHDSPSTYTVTDWSEE